MRGAQQPHPTLHVFTNIKHTYTFTVEKGTSPTLEGPGVYSLVRGPNFANAQCEAVWRRIPLGSVLQASRRGKNFRREYLMRVPLARRLAFANSRAQFGEIRNARQSAAASHQARLPKH
jgi:hypothetical protein